MGSIQVSHVGWRRPGGAELLRDVSFTVGNGDRVALVGANGVGKSTLLRLIAGETTATSGTIADRRPARGDAPARRRRTTQTVRDLLVSLAPQRLQAAAARLARAEAAAADEPMRYADGARRVGRRRRLRRRGVLGRVLHRRRSASRSPSSNAVRCARSAAASRSGWRSRPCCAATSTCCCSTSPTTSSTSPASAGWRPSCAPRRKTMLFVSHDRELLAATATQDRHRRGQRGVDARRRVRRLPRGPPGAPRTNREHHAGGVRGRAQEARGARRRDAPAGEDQRQRSRRG